MARGHSIYHYATKNDYAPVLLDVSSKFKLKYAVDEWLVEPAFRVYASPLDAPDFENFKWPKSLSTRFYVLPIDAELPFGYMPTRQSPAKYGFIPSSIPTDYRWVQFDPSGFHRSEEWGEGLLEGWLATNSEHPDSLAIFKAFKKSIQKHFEHIGICYVGQEAAEYLDSGGRLGQDLKLPRERNFRRPDESELGKSLRKNDPEKFAAALSPSIDLNARDRYGWSLIEMAVLHGSDKIVSYLLAQGVELGQAPELAQRYSALSEGCQKSFDLMKQRDNVCL